MEVLGRADGDQKGFIQSLKRTIKQNQTKINDLATKLIIAENNLASEKEKTKDKDDLINSLKLSINLLQSLNGTDCDQHKSKIYELNADIEILECKLKNRNAKIAELADKTEMYEINIKEKDEHIANLKSQIELSLDTTQKHESTLKERDEEIILNSDKNSDSLVFLNCTKIPSIQFVNDRVYGKFAAIVEELPSAGPGWMLIQRRIDGSVVPRKDRLYEEYKNGFGDLSREFWFGLHQLHILTYNTLHELYIELVDFDNATAYARYSDFVVGSEKEEYALKSVGEYSGNAGNCLRGGFKNKFLANGSSRMYGWWTNTDCNLNGQYHGCKTILESNDGIWWGTWNMGKRHSLKSCKMFIRPSNL